MPTFIRVTLILWFLAFTLFVLLPSFTVLSGVGIPGAADLPKMPEPPKPPTADDLKQPALTASVKTPQQPQGKIPDPLAATQTPQVEVRNALVDVYTQQVSAYTQQVAAYKSQIESGKTRQVAAYRAVVTDTLVSLLSTALTAFLGYVFVKAGAELVNKYGATKRGEKVESLKIL
jgi:hypothetical protein